MPSQDEMLAVRNYAKSLKGAQREEFISRYRTIQDDDAKVSVLVERIGKVGQGLQKPKDTTSVSSASGLVGFGESILQGRAGAEAKNTGENLKQASLGLVEGATAGIPRQIAKQMGYDIPKGDGGYGLVGQMTGFIAGPGKLARGVSKAGKLGKLKGLGGAAARGAVENSIGAVLLPGQNSDGLQDYAQDAGERALIGGAVGAPLGVATQAIGRFFDGGKLIKAAEKGIKRLNEEKLKLTDPMGKDAVRSRAIDAEKLVLNDKLAMGKKAIGEALTKNVTDLERKINSEAVRKSDVIKPSLVAKMRGFKKNWQVMFDDALNSSPSNTKASDVIKDIDQVYANLADRGIDMGGKPVEALEDLRAQMQALIKSKEVSSFVDEGENIRRSMLGLDPVKPNVTSEVTDPIINNRVLVGKVRAMRDNLTAQARKNGLFHVTDKAGSEFNSILGARYKNIPGIDKLNAEYSAFKKVEDFAFKKFKPTKESVNSSVKLFEDLGLGKGLSTDDARGIEKIEEFLGEPVTGRVRSLGDKLQFEKTFSKQNIEALSNSIKGKLRALDSEQIKIGVNKKQADYSKNIRIGQYKKLLEKLSFIKDIRTHGGTLTRRAVDYTVIGLLMKTLNQRS